VAHSYNLNTSEAEAGSFQGSGQLGLHSKFKASLRRMREDDHELKASLN
jgi:hypothetical protein